MIGLQRTIGNAAVARLLESERTERGAQAERPPSRQRATSAGLLRNGSKGDAVKRAQEQLNDLGASPPLNLDGDFGSRTEVAVRTFQAAHNLRSDGIIGEFTATMLSNEHALHGERGRTAPCHTPEDPGPDSGFDDGPGGEGPTVTGPKDRVGDGPAGSEKVIVRLSVETDPDKKKSDDAEAAAFGGVQESALTIAALDAVLAKHPSISTLGLLSHGTPEGKIFIGNQLVSLSELAAQLKARSGGAIGSIVFLGCSVGNDKAGLGDIKARLGAKNSEGASCNLRTLSAPPVPDGKGKPLLSVAEIRAAGSPDPAEAIRKNAKAALGSASRTGCIFGFSPAESIDSVPDEKIFKAYDEHKGVLTAKFTTTGETCYENLKYDKPDDVSGCKRVQA